MAGDWIKMRVNLSTDPAVKAMARNLKIDAFSVVGRLHTFWAWADEHTENGEIPWVTFEDIDDLVSKRGFAVQLELVGWLINLGEAIRLPNFDRHNGDSAKRRAMETEKKRRQRNGDRKPDDCPADVPTPSGQKPDTTGTREEKRREEKNNTSSCPTSAPPSPDAEKFVAWFLDLLAETEAPPPKLTPSIRANWAQCYDRMVRLDGRTKEDVKEVCRWARNDPFWKGNFLSPIKLRERKDGVMWFDHWLLKARTPASHGTTPPPAPARMMEPEPPLATRHGESLLPPEDDAPPEGSP